MRKQFIALSLGLLVFAVLIQSCEKEETVVSKDKQSHSSMRKGEEANPELRLIAFNSLIKEVRNNPEGFERKEFDYSLDSAIWYLEATMNYTYAYPNNKRSALILDSVFMDINLNPNNGLNIIEIQSKFDETLDILTSKFKSIESEHKFLVSVDYKIVKGENGNLILAAFYYFGNFDDYLPDGTWMITGKYSNHGGYTTDFMSTWLLRNYDGTDELEQELFNNNYVHTLDVFFVDDVMGTLYGATITPFNYAPCEPYYLYKEIFKPHDGELPLEVLTQDRMDIYVQNLVPILAENLSRFDKSIYLQDIEWSFMSDLSTGEHTHEYMYTNMLMGKMYPRTSSPQATYMQ